MPLPNIYIDIRDLYQLGRSIMGSFKGEKYMISIRYGFDYDDEANYPLTKRWGDTTPYMLCSLDNAGKEECKEGVVLNRDCLNIRSCQDKTTPNLDKTNAKNSDCRYYYLNIDNEQLTAHGGCDYHKDGKTLICVPYTPTCTICGETYNLGEYADYLDKECNKDECRTCEDKKSKKVTGLCVQRWKNKREGSTKSVYYIQPCERGLQRSECKKKCEEEGKGCKWIVSAKIGRTDVDFYCECKCIDKSTTMERFGCEQEWRTV